MYACKPGAESDWATTALAREGIDATQSELEYLSNCSRMICRDEIKEVLAQQLKLNLPWYVQGRWLSLAYETRLGAFEFKEYAPVENLEEVCEAFLELWQSIQ